MTLSLTSSRLTHLTCYWTLTPPVKVPFYRIQRGVRTFCGYTWVLLNCVPFEQNQPGLQLDKTFTVTPWPICNDAWWYLKGDTALGPSATTSIIYTDHFPGFPGPPLPAAPELIILERALIHNGNHYSFWSGSNWYAVLPFWNRLSVYKRTAGVWTLQDQANQPVFPPGQFTDLDARLSSDNTTFHIVSYLRASVYPPDTIMYYTYDLPSDSWAISEAIFQNTVAYQPRGRCSLSLDSNDAPHVVFDGRYQLNHPLGYSNRTTGAWSPALVFLSAYLANWQAFSASHDTADTFHAAANTLTYSRLYYNYRPAPGPIQAQQLLDASITNTLGPGLATFGTAPNIAVTDADFSMKHFLGPAPWAPELSISPPTSIFASAITPPTPVNRRYIVFRNPVNQTQGIFWKAGVWTLFPIPDPHVVVQLAASYTLPSVFSYIAVQAGAFPHTRFWAFTPPL